jgi:hypothetical protein
MEVQTNQRCSLMSLAWPRAHCPKFQRHSSLWWPLRAPGKVLACSALPLKCRSSLLARFCLLFLTARHGNVLLWNEVPLCSQFPVPNMSSSWNFCHVSAGRRQSVDHLCHHGGTASLLAHAWATITVVLKGCSMLASFCLALLQLTTPRMPPL